MTGALTRLGAFTLTRVPTWRAIEYACEGDGCFRGKTLVSQLRGRGIFRVKIDSPGFRKKTIRVTARDGAQPLIG